MDTFASFYTWEQMEAQGAGTSRPHGREGARARPVLSDPQPGVIPRSPPALSNTLPQFIAPPNTSQRKLLTPKETGLARRRTWERLDRRPLDDLGPSGQCRAQSTTSREGSGLGWKACEDPRGAGSHRNPRHSPSERCQGGSHVCLARSLLCKENSGRHPDRDAFMVFPLLKCTF